MSLIAEYRHGNNISSSAGNVNQSTRLSYASGIGGVVDSRVITKTHSASNVFSRTTNNIENNTRNSLNTEDYKVQYPNHRNDFTNNKQCRVIKNRQNVNNDQTDSGSSYNSNKSSFNDLNPINNTTSVNKCDRFNIRRGSSVENVNTTGIIDVNSNGNLKKLKYETEVKLILLANAK